MDRRGNAANPATTLGPNEYAALRVAPTRPDMSTIAEPGGYYGGSGGNQVDPARINRTLNELDKNRTQSKPLGQSHSNGF